MAADCVALRCGAVRTVPDGAELLEEGLVDVAAGRATGVLVFPLLRDWTVPVVWAGRGLLLTRV